ncbi:hypothetical protein SHI21_17315 [Bacteriovorax sp. PP10]|uniref:Lipoprotein n=1 Tax=Bacteriovorax antarcticus TaxID=3088717 RepID=A0ABU5W148_9BACT|nr:hypothetical protein [Bacteriovorax sp. PP10]MEA9357995.1 hypothetical protein [Bacteriovorax sp. PP10]
MKKCSLVLSLMILSACSTVVTKDNTMTYQKDYCSKRAQEYLGSYEYKVPRDRNSTQKKLYEMILEKSNNVQPCYVEHVRNNEVYNVCIVVGTDKKGVLSFIDIEDAQKPLSKAFAKCLVDVYGSMSLKSFPDTKVMQPLLLDPKK